ncbi:MAG: DUF503 domain-containing protein [Myxococcota bacterium]
MLIGISRVGLVLPGNDSLKGKRSVVRKILDRVRARFHVSAAEVEEHDVHQRAVLGFCTVGSDGRKIQQVLDRLLDFVEDTGLAQVVSSESEVVGYSDLVGELEMESYAEKFGMDDLPWSDEEGKEKPPESLPKRRETVLKPGSLGFGSGSAEGKDDDEPLD